VVHALMNASESVDEVVAAIAPPASLDVTLVLRAARQVEAQLAAAAAHGR
jgi:hypothetical protein